MTDDSKIIELFFERSEQAIDLLTEKYGELCLRTARNILPSELDAEECVNDAFLAVWNNIPPERPDPLVSYLCRIVRNLSLKKLRSNNASKRSTSETNLDEIAGCIASRTNIEQELDAKELSQHLNSFLAKLSADERVLFVRRYWFGDSLESLSTLFNTSEHNISARLYRTRQKLGKYLRKEGVTL